MMELETAVVFSLCQPRLACEFAKFHAAIEFISGQSVWTHSLPRVFKELRPHLEQQFPWAFSGDAIAANYAIADAADSGDRDKVRLTIDSQMIRLSSKYGAVHMARVIDDPTSVYKNPLTEAEEIFGDKLVVVKAEEADDHE